jgi:hypothetical protein
MKPINVTKAADIEAALKAVNGRSTSHTFTTSGEIAFVADEAEKALERLNIPKSERAGAVYVAQSGEKLPSAYKYEATTTTVRLVRKSGGWYLDEVHSTTLYPRSKPHRHLRLTAEQDTIAVAALRRNYTVAQPVVEEVAA